MDNFPLTKWIAIHYFSPMTYNSILNELDEYCAAAGLKPSTVCVRALNDSRYVTRHNRRIEVLERDAQKIRDYIAANPAQTIAIPKVRRHD